MTPSSENIVMEPKVILIVKQSDLISSSGVGLSVSRKKAIDMAKHNAISHLLRRDGTLEVYSVHSTSKQGYAKRVYQPDKFKIAWGE